MAARGVGARGVPKPAVPTQPGGGGAAAYGEEEEAELRGAQAGEAGERLLRQGAGGGVVVKVAQSASEWLAAGGGTEAASVLCEWRVRKEQEGTMDDGTAGHAGCLSGLRSGALWPPVELAKTSGRVIPDLRPLNAFIPGTPVMRYRYATVWDTGAGAQPGGVDSCAGHRSGLR